MTPFRPLPGQGAALSRSIDDYPGGIVLAVDKPYRWTSADVIRKLKYAAIRHFGKKNLKVGHAGTLDPLATGVLLVCIGNACKLAQAFQDHDKSYEAGIRFGATTPSYDLEKEVDRTFPYDHITEEAVHEVLPSFLGEQEQVAPLFSAKSVDGVRAYEMARKLYRQALRDGTAASFDAAAADLLQRNRIVISEIELLGFFPGGADASSAAPGPSADAEASSPDTALPGASSRIQLHDTAALGLPEALIRVTCSKGTYIRALARDLGEALGTGAHLGSLVRTRSGDFPLTESLSLPEALSLFSH